MKLLLKSRGHKYLKKWKDSKGKDHYVYAKVKKDKGKKAPQLLQEAWEAKQQQEKDRGKKSPKLVVGLDAIPTPTPSQIKQPSSKQNKLFPQLDFPEARSYVKEKAEVRKKQASYKDKYPIRMTDRMDSAILEQIVDNFMENLIYDTEVGGYAQEGLDSNKIKNWLNDQEGYLGSRELTADNFGRRMLAGRVEDRDILSLAILTGVSAEEAVNLSIAMDYIDDYVDGHAEMDANIRNWFIQNKDAKPWNFFSHDGDIGGLPIERMFPTNTERQKFFYTLQQGESFQNAMDSAKISITENKQLSEELSKFYTPGNLNGIMTLDKIASLERYATMNIDSMREIGTWSGVNTSYVARGEIDDREDKPFCLKPTAGEYDGDDLRVNVPEGTFATREACAYLVDQAFGFDLVPPTVLRGSELGECSLQVWDEEATLVIKDPDMDILSTELTKGAIFDYIVYNTDRHNKNYMYNESTDKLVFIDNGLTLPDFEMGWTYTSNCHYQAEVYSVEMDIPYGIMKQIQAVDLDNLVDVLRAQGLSDEACGGLVDRVTGIKEAGVIPSYSEIARYAG